VILNQHVTIEHVNAYSRADGSPYTGIEIPAGGNVGTSSGVRNAPYWLDREPRFYASIAYNGMEHPTFCTNALPNDLDEQGKQIHWWKFSGGTQAPYYDCARSDLLAHNSVKLTDTNINGTIADGNHSGIDWPLIRYAEVLLNLAECAAKTGNEAEAIQILSDIRKRGGIPAGANNYGLGRPSGDELILAILNERRVELAFEGFRFWDARRWRLFTDPIAGVKINGMMRHTLKPEPKVDITPAVLATIDLMNDPGSYFEVFDNHIYVMDSEPFRVSERQYFYRIAYEEHIKKNPNLAQTNLWENGTFDPYE
jgi:hypothetical protein